MDARETNRLVRETIDFPVKYDNKQQTIWDSKGMMVCDIRGWGRIQFMNKSEERQDAIGIKIAKLLNESAADCVEYNDEIPESTNAFPPKKEVVPFEWD